MRDFPRAARRGATASAAVTAALACAAFGGTGTGTGEARRSPAWCKPGGTLTARAMPQRVKITDCDLRGRTVRGSNGLSAVVPSDGTSLVAHALRTDGAAELRIGVDARAGEITIATRSGRDPQGRPRHFRAAAAACDDGAHRPESSKWPKGTTVQWRYSPGTAGLPRDPIAKGIANMVNANTDCTDAKKFTPPPDIGENYAGQSDQGPNVTGAAACGKRDQANTFGWLAMPDAENDVLAATCTWFNGATTVETDMALQTQGRRWWTSGTCPAGSYSAEAVATHEAGHVLGLAHIEGTEHAELTMAPAVASCDDGPATLGKGDYDGLIALYGGR
ncbi:matrixin family metalloprotease [Actinomadura darangshiensis]|uniref:Matrixin family metalloprotease n=1 Tax=Actinomadura darangshiensis TaxID=705336 RepID=A0A4R5A867_9ACTN|nr:matrixin family metalloprotease [Actinomadura darangshiensis]TDD68398.1 matrixin family metalloprotease [Actinomadura darangshiensis]